MFQLLLVIIYLAFISLGLPDSLLGSAWPSMYPEFGVPVSYAGGISMIIALGTVVSSLMSDRLTRRLGTGRVTALSVATTAIAMLGFSWSHSYVALLLWAIPYGLGAGSVDAALNNYVALHYASRHMSWLHCMWGVGTSVGPYIMGLALTGGQPWNMGYRIIGLMQVALTAVLFLTLPLWKGGSKAEAEVATDTAEAEAPAEPSHPLSLREVIALPGAIQILVMFFCYSAVEQTAMLWASSYLNLHNGLSAETAASYASMFCIGITVGRGLSGFITMRLNDEQMIRLGQAIILAGVVLLFIPGSDITSLAGLIMVGLGCAPIYPSIIHSTPAHFGADRSQAVIGVQMAFAYVGTCLMPPLFGQLADRICGIGLFPFYLLAFLVLMFVMHEMLLRQEGAHAESSVE